MKQTFLLSFSILFDSFLRFVPNIVIHVENKHTYTHAHHSICDIYSQILIKRPRGDTVSNTHTHTRITSLLVLDSLQRMNVSDQLETKRRMFERRIINRLQFEHTKF